MNLADVKLPSNRKFGLLFAAVFAVAAIYFLIKGHSFWSGAFGVLSGAFLVLALTAADLLEPLNKLWFRFGLLLGRIVSPIVLGLLYFVLLTPYALISRAFGRDELRLKRRDTASYWVRRAEPGPTPESFKAQF